MAQCSWSPPFYHRALPRLQPPLVSFIVLLRCTLLEALCPRSDQVRVMFLQHRFKKSLRQRLIFPAAVFFAHLQLLAVM
jgi:hypothetical protein